VPPGLDELRGRGLTLKSFEVGAPPSLLGGAKTTSYDVSFAARRDAERAGADDALLVGAGHVLEGAAANIWWRRGDQLYTPAVRPGVLPGVTRAFVRSLDPAREGEFALAELLAADEAFLTSSIREVMPVVEIDGVPIGDGRPGPAAARLQDALRLRSAS
jgi:branched-subunit amino acid aminotransferase/4-amino-4-deoxychorismate lyase